MKKLAAISGLIAISLVNPLPVLGIEVNLDRPVSSDDAPDVSINQNEIKIQQGGSGSSSVQNGTDIQIDVQNWTNDSVNQKVEWMMQNGQYKMNINSDGAETGQSVELDSNNGQTRIKVRNSGGEQEIRIEINGETMVLEQNINGSTNSVKALTNLPVTFDEENGTLSVTTSAGNVVIKNLPAEAFNSAVNGANLDEVTSVTISEDETTGQPVYKVEGVNTAKFLNLIPVNANVSVNVSPTTGDALQIQQPWFLQYLGFLFA